MNDHNDLRNRSADTLREIRVMENWLELRLARAHSVIIGTKDHAVHEALSEVKVRLDAIRAAALSQHNGSVKPVPSDAELQAKADASFAEYVRGE